MTLPPYIDRQTIHERLPLVFPEGTPNRNYCVREMAASVVFTMLYIGAIEGTGKWLAPKHVVRMTEDQAAVRDDPVRVAYGIDVMRPGFAASGTRWYQENSREPLRDETLKQGLIGNSAVVERAGLPTTSSHPRYALTASFAALFDPAIAAEALQIAIERWQSSHLSPVARGRIALIRRGAGATGEGVLVRFPNGETRRMASGKSSDISRAVIEDFAERFLVRPAVLWLSESGAKVVARDDELARSLGIQISADRLLPDIILVDLGQHDANGFLIVFVEVVATDGPITEARRTDMLRLSTDGGFPPERVAFVTAYLDREQSAFKRTVPNLAWGTFAWFASEPQRILAMHGAFETAGALTKLMLARH